MTDTNGELPKVDTYTVNEVAKYLRVDPQTIYDWINAKKIECLKFGSGQRPRVRITKAQLEAFLNRVRVSS